MFDFWFWLIEIFNFLILVFKQRIGERIEMFHVMELYKCQVNEDGVSVFVNRDIMYQMVYALCWFKRLFDYLYGTVTGGKYDEYYWPLCN